MVSVCLTSDAVLQHLLSYLGFSYLGVEYLFTVVPAMRSQLLFTSDKGYVLTVPPPDPERGIAPLGTPVPAQPPLLGHGVAPPGCHP